MKSGDVPQSAGTPARTQAVLRGWHRLQKEPIIEPALPIIDAHHHLWNRPPDHYETKDLLADTSTGHHIIATCFVECTAGYRETGPLQLRPVGETEYISRLAREADTSGTKIAAAISGYADLRLGDRVIEVLEAHIQAGEGRFRGIRQQAQFDPELGSLAKRPTPEGLLRHPMFKAGFARLAPLGLLFEAWVFFSQLNDVIQLATEFPDTVIVLNHIGGPIAVGPYAEDRAAYFSSWKLAMKKLAMHENVRVKVGGLGMKPYGHAFYNRPTPPTSIQLAAAWRPHIETTIELFGADRCMFESNFPVDADSCSYPTLWNAFKRITMNTSPTDKFNLFSRTAAETYGLTPLLRAA